MKKHQPCNYRGADFLYVKTDDEGVHLKSTVKHLEQIIVPHKYKQYVNAGFVPQRDKRRSRR